MSDTQSDQPGQRSASGGLTLNLSSNNPFRNRGAASPSLIPKSPASPFDDPPRPVSRNPFLDPANKTGQVVSTPVTMATATASEKTISPTAEELFDTLTLEDSSKKIPALVPEGQKDGPLPRDGPPRNGPPRGPPPMGRRGPPRGENMPPPGRRPPPNHRPSRSQEEALRARRMQGNGNAGPVDPSSPQKRVERRPRRNSESSVMSTEKPLTEEEKKQREQRRRERERRHRDRGERDRERDRDGKEKPRPNRRMDIIDQLDATSIYGTGLFHHDGPFDALNPHRNRNGKRAPMQAFPKDSLNNVLGGSGPLNTRPDHATFMGNGEEEAFKDFANSAALEKMGSSSNMPVFDPLSRGSVLHGDESMGLGTSTFLEGTPAARTTIQRREAEKATDPDGGLARKKSLAQRIRGMNRPGPREFQPSGRMTNPEGVYVRRSPPADMPTPTAASASMQGSAAERNPFFADFDGMKNEETITVRRTDNKYNNPRSPTSPVRGLERRATTDATSPEDGMGRPAAGSGLLARVKSLKGGRKTRPTDAPAPPSKDA